MTGRARPTDPQDFAVQMAENEGMPPEPDTGYSRAAMPHPRKQTGTLRPGAAKRDAGTGRALPAGKDPKRSDRKPAGHRLARVISRLAMAAGLIASFAFPVLAQDGTGPVPENAQTRSYGSGWDCDLGYRVEAADCLALEIPENAYATGRSYGTGWTCRRGYQEVRGTSCSPIPVPENAHLQSSGYDWQCDRGYRRERGGCLPVVLPDHAYLTGGTSGSGWTCDRGYAADAGSCLPIAVPENGYLTNASFGAAWACERGFVEVAGRCDAILLPENAFLDPETYGPGWRCERGYEPRSGDCNAIDLPDNAHLDRSGNRWRCDQGFQLAGEVCARGR